MSELELPLREHVAALRQTILLTLVTLCTGFCSLFPLYSTFFEMVLGATPGHSFELILTGPMEGFSTACAITFWSTLLLCSPILTVVWLRFLAPALTPLEQKALPTLLLGVSLCCLLMLWIGYQFTLPWSLHYFSLFNQPLGNNLWSVRNYVSYVVWILCSHVLIGIILFVLLFSVKQQWIGYHTLRHYRKHSIVLFLIIAALLTPPDVISQLMVAIPLVVIYEGVLVYAKWREKRAHTT